MDLKVGIFLFLILLVMLLWGFVVLQRRQKQLEQSLQQQHNHLQSLSKQLQLLTDGTYGLGQQLSGLKGTVQTRNTTPQENSSSGDISLRQAIELARKGATVDELIEVCGLSRGEAELLTTMHKQPSN